MQTVIKNHRYPAADVRRHLLRSQEGCSSFPDTSHKCQESFCKLWGLSSCASAELISNICGDLPYILGWVSSWLGHFFLKSTTQLYPRSEGTGWHCSTKLICQILFLRVTNGCGWMTAPRSRGAHSRAPGTASPVHDGYCVFLARGPATDFLFEWLSYVHWNN